MIVDKRADAGSGSAGPEQLGIAGDVFVQPASLSQRSLWFLDQLEPGSARYNMPWAYRLRGALNPAALERALRAIVERHETLRTTYGAVAGQPVQVIAPHPHFALARLDLGDVPADQREERARLIAEEEARRPFDLARGPLFRALLIQLGPVDWLFVLTFHHIVSDGFSEELFARELDTLYRAFDAGGPSPLPDLPIQYADYSAWQSQRLQEPAVEQQLAFWREQLQGAPHVLNLPTDRPRPSVRSDGGGTASLVLPAPLVDSLRQLANAERSTLYMVLLALFQTLLHRQTGQVDFLVGSPVAGRVHPETEGLIGYFVNTVVLRARLEEDPPFRRVLRQARKTTLDALAHQELPFETLVEALRPARDPAHHPLVQVMFVLQSPAQPTVLGVQAEPYSIHTGTSKFDLTLSGTPVGDELECRLEYATDLFEAATIERMLTQLRVLAESVARDPDQAISALPLLTPVERHRVLVEWNQTTRPFPRQATVHGVFQEQVALYPDRPALRFGDDQLTYRALDVRANRLAHRLRRFGVGPGVMVGLLLERSAQAIVAMLAVLKAGGAYVPLDPAHPKDRVAFMLRDAEIAVVLTQTGLFDRLPDGGPPVVCVDRDAAAIEAEPTVAPACGATAGDPAYVIYTSGSTGTPKGVVVPHRAVNRLVLNTDYIQLGPGDRVAQVSTLTFDAATFEVWGALLAGAELVGIEKDVALSPTDFAAEVRQEGIDSLFLTTSLFNLIAHEEPGAFSGVRDVLFGGEAADVAAARAVLGAAAPARLVNVYGPTETTTFATWHVVESVPAHAATIPIGRPIANTTLYVLDAHQQPVPIGTPGELYVGGDGVALGYLNHPELTELRFVPDPFSPVVGARLYRTGDIVRYRPDGAVEFLGRADDQVKIRGHRIELGEIEAALASHPAVRECVVLAREDAPGQKRLVAYLTSGPAHHGASDADLREVARRRLPEYMLPTAYVWLESLPLNDNGKVDRPSLPPPSVGVHQATGAAPASPTERALAELWSELLGIEGISRDDDFFALGGHSLLATQLIARILKRLDVRVPVRRLFESPTVCSLAEWIDRHRVGSDSEEARGIIPVQPQGTLPPLFLVPGGDDESERPVLKFGELSRHLGPDQPFFALQAVDPGRASDPRGRVAALAARHLDAVRAVQPRGPYFLLGDCIGGVVAFEMAQQLVARGEQVGLLALLDTTKPSRSEHLRYLLFSRTLWRVRWHWQELRRRRYGARVGYLLEHLRAFAGGGRRHIGEESDARRLALGRARAHDCMRYVPNTYPGKIVFVASESVYRRSGCLGWDAVASEGVEPWVLSGDHHSYLRVGAEALALRLRTHLAAVRAAT